MKKLTYLMLICLVAVVACKKEESPEEKARNFAGWFVEKVTLNQTDSLAQYYDAIVDADSLATVMSDTLLVIENTPGNFDVTLAEGITMNLSIDPENGAIKVNNTKGLFAYPDNVVQLAQRKGLWDTEQNDVEQQRIISELLEAYRNFTSPDLCFLYLHGPVKSMTISGSGFNNCGWGWNGTYQINEEGVWTNPGAIFRELYKVKRNSEGYIVEGERQFPELELGEGYISYKWSDNNLYSYEQGGGLGDGFFKYENGQLAGIDYNYPWEQEDKYRAFVKMFDFVTDEYGNWISCKWKKTLQEPSGYDHSKGHFVYRTLHSSGTMNRTLTYY